ncbi:16S rRNA (cytosine(1402)-N(4))-methyltransferase RsmH [Candidatus Sneabacter namystus]|uniref:Ribosomal RNA small subunit methyltransferase H n=1 Tax=Candidatus Sneabacter namystus TaxID=2601646 RepID=A0A5C0UJP2_9RICK|nr:16S rRNA (cytosine(1402)-N(4))-methyltransferase RsmH [Candidatus Sneabacter namystus]QEK39702.1 16S rRNA (cytosine(1402)-N(4))-methyltransferase RsmH [Candidatus Sneabacter namystus]
MPVKNHIPVLLKQVIHYLDPQDDHTYVDCTFGMGGHSKAILQTAKCNVIGFDVDPSVIQHAKDLQKQYNSRFKFIQSNFADLDKHIPHSVDGFLFDLGTSTMQLTDPGRGFSFLYDGPLNMRMDNAKNQVTAQDIVNNFSESQLSEMLYKNSNERYSKKIAKAIVQNKQFIQSTTQLAQLIRNTLKRGKYRKIDVSTKTFQALRMEVNQELKTLQDSLTKITNLLKQNGKLVTIAFHALEDSIIKDFLRKNSVKKISRSKYAKEEPTSAQYQYKILTKKPITPDKEELQFNDSSRSAKLRVAIRI